MKIEYINKRPTYAKAVVSVVDHVECRCQPAPRPAVPRKKSSRRQHNHQHRNQTLSQGYGHEQVQYECYQHAICCCMNALTASSMCINELYILHTLSMQKYCDKKIVGQMCLCFNYIEIGILLNISLINTLKSYSNFCMSVIQMPRT